MRVNFLFFIFVEDKKPKYRKIHNIKIRNLSILKILSCDVFERTQNTMQSMLFIPSRRVMVSSPMFCNFNSFRDWNLDCVSWFVFAVNLVHAHTKTFTKSIDPKNSYSFPFVSTLKSTHPISRKEILRLFVFSSHNYCIHVPPDEHCYGLNGYLVERFCIIPFLC